MSNYDRIAISDKPDIYFSSNSSSDQSGTLLYSLTNGLSNVGQPIIIGNPSSWRVSPTESLVIDDNPIFFRSNTHLEVVIQVIQPTQTVCVFGDSSEFNGIFLSPTSAEIRFIDADLIQRSASLSFDKWPEKMYLTLVFDETYCTLRINDKIAQIRYRETDPASIASVSFKTSSGNTYYIDGLGIYSSKFTEKSDYINELYFDYLDFINKTFSATGTLFDGYRELSRRQISSAQFSQDPVDSDYYVYTMTFPLGSDEDFSSISIESNYRSMDMQYQTNDVTWSSFVGHASFTPSSDFFLLQIRAKTVDVRRSFILDVCSTYDDRIMTHSPAKMTPNGGPLYPETHTLSIVNFPDGVELYNISYQGQWIEYIPNSVEIVFMLKDSGKTIIFESSDGSVSCGTGGSISGFTAYLNGVLVTDLDDIRLNQWNHLIITKVSTAASIFYLNSDSSRAQQNIIEYCFLASYPSVLSLGSASQAYAIIGGFHKASITENPSDIVEGELDGVSPFKAYTYAWAIIGGGGI